MMLLQGVAKKPAAKGAKKAPKVKKGADPLFPARPKSFRVGGSIQVIGRGHGYTSDMFEG